MGMTDMLPLAPNDPGLPDLWRPMNELTMDSEVLFDVLAKYYCAHSDKFMVRRFCDCFRQDGKTVWPNPFEITGQIKVALVILEDHGFRPIMWMPLPNNPAELPE